MSEDVLEQVEGQSRYAFPQILTYLRYHERVFEAHVAILGSPVRAAILRAIGERELSHASGTNAASISQSIPVPRETVRRHLRWLEEHGFVVKEGPNYRVGEAVLGEFIERLDERIDDMLKSAEQIRNFRSNSPPLQ